MATKARPTPTPCSSSTLADGKSVKELLDEANATIGEKIEVKRVARLEGEHVVSYLHKTSPDLPAQIGVLVATAGGDEQAARDVAMHIAAFSPTVLTREEVDAATVENERRVAEATAKEEGKPEAALPRIVEGRVNGYFKENVLLEQPFAKDPRRPSPRSSRRPAPGARASSGTASAADPPLPPARPSPPEPACRPVDSIDAELGILPCAASASQRAYWSQEVVSRVPPEHDQDGAGPGDGLEEPVHVDLPRVRPEDMVTTQEVASPRPGRAA